MWYMTPFPSPFVAAQKIKTGFGAAYQKRRIKKQELNDCAYNLL
jgi:hypothetical protein